MQKNILSIVTLIRNRLNNQNSTLEEKLLWFHEKGVTVTIEDDDLFFLKSDLKGHISELTETCSNGIVFRGGLNTVFSGVKVYDYTLEEAKKLPKFIWNEKTFFIQDIEGQNAYMFWDPKINDWNYSSDTGPKSPFKALLKRMIKNRMKGELNFTYHLKIVEKTKKSGIYLFTSYNNRSFREVAREKTYQLSKQFGFNFPDLYLFEGFDKLEETDFPLLVRDISDNKIRITSLK